MKRFVAFLCMLTCVFGLTACNGEETVNAYQAEKQTVAEQYAIDGIIPLMEEKRHSVDEKNSLQEEETVL